MLNKKFICFQLDQYRKDYLINKIVDALLNDDISVLSNNLAIKRLNDIQIDFIYECIEYMKNNCIICRQHGNYWEDNYSFHDPNKLINRLIYIMFFLYNELENERFDNIGKIINEMMDLDIDCEEPDEYDDDYSDCEIYGIVDLFDKFQVDYFSEDDYKNVYLKYLDYLDNSERIHDLNIFLNKINQSKSCYLIDDKVNELAKKHSIKLNE